MKVTGAVLLVLMSLSQNAVSGQLSPAWTVLNRSGDYANGELQCYIPANVIAASGNMVLNFQKQGITCHDSNTDGGVRNGPTQFSYTSAMVQMTKFNFTFGTVEVRAQIPNTSLWPAIWMIGADCQASNIISADNVGGCNWFASGSDEIDIAEFAPNDPSVRQNSFSNGDGKFTCGSGPNVGGDGKFHVFGFTWTATSLSWAVDGVTNCTTNNRRYIPAKPMFLLMNIASNNSAQPSGLPQTMQVDYAKVTQNGTVIFFDDFVAAGSASCDLNGDGVVDTRDVQIAISQTFGVVPCGSADLNGDGLCNVIDVQRVVNAARGQPCRIGR